MVMAILPIQAQMDAQFSQYYQVPTYYNAAASGTTDYLRVAAGGRLQWVGVDNAPMTFLASGDMPFKLFGKRFGVGLNVSQESIGLYRTLDISASLSYGIKLLGGRLNAGLSLGFVNQTFKGTEVFIPDDDDFHDANDPTIPTADITGNALDLGVGLWYARKGWWAGVSATHVNSPSVTLGSGDGGSTSGSSGAGTTADNAETYTFQVGRTLYFMAGGNIPIKNTLLEILPSIMFKTDFHFTTGEADVRLRYAKFLSVGVGYRYDDAVTALVAANIKNAYLGLAYDYPTSSIAKASSGSFEFFIGYSLKLDFGEKNRHRHKSIRIM